MTRRYDNTMSCPQIPLDDAMEVLICIFVHAKRSKPNEFPWSAVRGELTKGTISEKMRPYLSYLANGYQNAEDFRRILSLNPDTNEQTLLMKLNQDSYCRCLSFLLRMKSF